MSTGVTNRMGEAAEGEGTDGGSERAEEIGETDHLRSVGRRRKPVGEGRSPLDSVLQRDRRRGRGGVATDEGGKWKQRDKVRAENGQDRRAEGCERQGRKLARLSRAVDCTGSGRNLGCHSSAAQNACTPQMFALNINNMPNKPLCSSLQLQLPLHNAKN